MSSSPSIWQGRRPGTIARTGARRRLLAAPSPTPSTASSLSASSRLSRIRRESGGNHIAVLNRLLNTLKENEVPGPQFFRLNEEFSEALGEGGQGNVRGINEKSAKLYQKSDKSILAKWPADLIAIKQYQRKMVARQTQDPDSHAREVDPSEHDLGSRFRAAECEVLALSPSLFRDHPNIVQLMGWGLCLDTLERPDSACCGFLQIPLLVLERAEMNLWEFLQRLFPKRVCNPEIRAEEGFAGSLLCRSGGPERTGMLKSIWSAMSQWTGFQMDPYEIVRLLCIDIGHGLQSLHEHKFTHGDLKPENVLIFKHHVKGWRAKLCDFGCARGQPEEAVSANGATQGAQQEKEQYLGTPAWLPPKDEAGSEHDYDGLRKCDLYVYGLIVWSSFCLKGDPPPHNPKLEDAQVDLEKFAGRRRWVPDSKRWLAERITEVLKKTMTDHQLRDPKPWVCLYRWRERAAQAKRTAKSMGGSLETQNSSNAPSISPSASTGCEPHGQTPNTKLKVRPPLSSLSKAKYNERSWWPRRTGSDTSVTSQVLGTATEDLTGSASNSPEPPQVVLTAPHDTPEEEGSGPASSMALSPDDNSLGTTLFQDDKRREDAKRLFQQMKETVKSWQKVPSSSEDLYCYARFRSRIRPEWWMRESLNENILDQALKLVPAVDICTLAWLCNGPVGKSEIQGLAADYETWRVVLDPTVLNESERLDRFLLLLQFGARVEQRISWPPNVNWGATYRSIFAIYIKSCRPATVPTVMGEICRRFNEVKDSEHILPSTRRYMTSSDGDYEVPTAAQDLRAEDNGEAVTELWRHGLIRRGDAKIQTSRSHSDERTPLLLPLGWRKLEKPGATAETAFYEEEFTQSITLTRPKVSLMRLRQIKIGFIDKGKGHMCHLDLASCMPPGMGMMNRKLFNDNITTRFPFYNEDWFDMEWNTEPSQTDVLESLREAWKLPTFAIRVRMPEIDIWEWLVWAGGILGRVALLVAIVAAIVIFFPFVLLPFIIAFIYSILMVFFPEGWFWLGFVSAKVAALLFWVWFIGWTCPGAAPVFQDDGRLKWPHGKDNCATCSWIILTWWNCS